jgi:hypothetical protein
MNLYQMSDSLSSASEREIIAAVKLLKKSGSGRQNDS